MSHLKSDWAASNFIGAYSISFKSSNAGKFFGSWILKDCIEGQKKKKESRCLVFKISTKREI